MRIRRYEEKSHALLSTGRAVMRGEEEFHRTMVALHKEAVALSSRGGTGKPPTAAESKRAFWHADADHDGS